MKSNRQRRAEIKAKRAKRAMKRTALRRPGQSLGEAPSGSLPADHSALSHNNTYGLLPDYYVDQRFICRDCGAQEVWTASQQKWWYEVAKGHIDSRAVRCRACRRRIRDRKTAQKRHMEAMAVRPRHPNEAFFRRRMRLPAG
ncbi:hypothetical protein G3480_16085 [Thiorhodococcus mannitoliphagus]|uniref:Probable zinc-binding domain-containing protein n=1 Tax=Thiorhodococcus mannitoliphagus TaxID=329406 RepID=A0A6P1DWJ0_9GAMM|nr:zinc-ribbon domain containing protein [Thiorhodococcus mannitoliphagus]NEX21810.1 hypothetical protein [Thiorhodococcus mannitoliphagus]